MLLGIDIGTTNSKAGVFQRNGQTVSVASRETMTHRHEEGYSYYDPEQMWTGIASAINEALEKAGHPQIDAIGITSMAESGLLVDNSTGKPKSIFMPWFDTVSEPQAKRIAETGDVKERFAKSGLLNSFKLGLAKILWLKDREPESLVNSTWLSASSYIAYRLTGKMAIDYTLAARTYCFRIDEKRWDREWIREFGLDESIFPEAVPSGATVGNVHVDAARATGLHAEVPVAIGGHDHVCAALAVGAITPGIVYDSMGTAETLVGTFPEQPLGVREYESGLSFGCHLVPGQYFWMGGNTSAGGSVEWVREVMGETKASYEDIMRWLGQAPDEPSGILYFPYLSGSGAPLRDSQVKGSLIGLTREHGKPEILQAILEGTGYQLEAIRQEAQAIAGHPIDQLIVVGGGTRNARWLQIKADIVNCSLEVPPIEEATMLGAALAAGAGAGVYGSMQEAAEAVERMDAGWVKPREHQHQQYRKWYEEGFAALQQPLRDYFRGRYADV